MIFGLLFEVFIKAFLLLILLYIVARDEADFEFRKVTMVTAGLTLGAVILDAFLTRYIGMLTIIPIAALAVFMVMKFCWVRFWRSLLVVIPFLMLNIMISSSVSSFQKKADTAVMRGLQGPISDEDMKVALSMFQDGGRSNMFLVPMQSKMPEVRESADQILVRKLMELLSSKFKPAASPVDARAGEHAAPGPLPPPVKQKKPEPEPEKSIETDSPLDWREAEKHIRLKGVMVGRDGVRVVMVNNQMIREGECLQVEYKKTLYRWRAGVIRENKVSWEPVEALSK
jgi:hypothetical protein